MAWRGAARHGDDRGAGSDGGGGLQDGATEESRADAGGDLHDSGDPREGVEEGRGAGAPDGSSAAWHLVFTSEGSKAHVTIGTMRGALTCWADAESAGRAPDFKPDFFRDGAKLYALAKQHGGGFLGEGYAVMIQTASAPSTRHATWYINYSKDNKDAPLSVIVNANTGAVEQVVKH